MFYRVVRIVEKILSAVQSQKCSRIVVTEGHDNRTHICNYQDNLRKI